MKVAGYVRVSTEAQAGEDRFGIDAQMAEIKLWCEREGHKLIKWFIDSGVSGASEERPEFDKLIYNEDYANPPIEAVVVAKSDRIARDIMVYYYYKHELLKKDIKLISVAEDFGAMGEYGAMFEALIAVMAELERSNIRKRMAGGRMVKARAGGYAGGRVPYGYKADKTTHALEIDEEEASAVRIIFDHPEISLRNMAAYLDMCGYKPRKGTHWSASSIQGIRANKEFYEGNYRYAGIEVGGLHEPILGESTEKYEL